VFLLPAGRLAARLGAARAHALGYAAFAGGCGACALSGESTMLLIARVVQAAGAAAILASTAPLVFGLAPARHRGIVAVGLAGLAVGWPGAGSTAIIVFVVVLGAGMGASGTPITRAIMTECGRERRCRAGAWLSLARNGGHGIGVLFAVGVAAISGGHVAANMAAVALLLVGVGGMALWGLAGSCALGCEAGQ
jgi:hypothetical protein